ncbi:KRAB domain-containing zinc finger protein, partial [Clonorchis sinensis]
AEQYETPEHSAIGVTSAISIHQSEPEHYEHIGQTHMSQAQKMSYRCPECSKIFRYPSWLCQHMESHSDLRSYKCGFCASTFKSPRNRKNHLLEKHLDTLAASAHAGNTTYSRLLKWKMYLCQYCCKIFRTQSALNKHAGGHTGDRPYACDRCKNTFKTPSILTRHRKQCRQQTRNDT